MMASTDLNPPSRISACRRSTMSTRETDGRRFPSLLQPVMKVRMDIQRDSRHDARERRLDPDVGQGQKTALCPFRPDLETNGLAALQMSMPDGMQFLSCARLPRRVNVVVADQFHPLPLCIGPLDILSIGRISAAFSFCPFLVARVVAVLDLAVSSYSSTRPGVGSSCSHHQTVCQILKNKTVCLSCCLLP